MNILQGNADQISASFSMITDYTYDWRKDKSLLMDHSDTLTAGLDLSATDDSVTPRDDGDVVQKSADPHEPVIVQTSCSRLPNPCPVPKVFSKRQLCSSEIKEGCQYRQRLNL